MSNVAAFYRNYELPWTITPEERARLERIFRHILGVLGVLAILMPFLPVREVDRTAAPEMPQRFARLVAERKAPPPPVVKEQPKPVEAVQPKPDAAVAVEPPKPQPEAKPASVPREKPAAAQVRDAPADGAGNGTDVAREKAARAGLVAFADQLADLRDSAVVAGATASRPLSDAVGPGARAERSLVTSATGKGSGGINTAALSRNTGGGGGGQGFGSLEGRAITQVSGPAGLGSSVAAAGEARAAASEGRSLQRSREEIELVFDRNKGAIYALYHRALREDSTLQGKLVLKLTIASSGKVTSCEVVSSELNAPELERKLVQRVLLFDFGAKDVEEITTTKPIDFFPA
jgi:outer membrane biosynthesis protein TonB